MADFVLMFYDYIDHMIFHIVAIDINDEKLEFARSIGAEVIINSKREEVVKSVLEITRGGAHVSIDALGSPETCINSIDSLR